MSTQRAREPCHYGSACYRVNPDHLARFSHPCDDDCPAGSTSDAGASAATLAVKDLSADEPVLHLGADVQVTCDSCGEDCSADHYHAAVSTIPGKQEGDDLCPRHWRERVRSGAPSAAFLRVIKQKTRQRKALKQTTANKPQKQTMTKRPRKNRQSRVVFVRPTPFQDAVRYLETAAAAAGPMLPVIPRFAVAESRDKSAELPDSSKEVDKRGLPLVAKVKNRALSCAQFALAEKEASSDGCWSQQNGEFVLVPHSSARISELPWLAYPSAGGAHQLRHF